MTQPTSALKRAGQTRRLGVVEDVLLDHETRLRTVEKFQWILIGIASATSLASLGTSLYSLIH